MSTLNAPLVVGTHTFASRLLVGTGKYPDQETAARALEASGAQVVTVAVRRVNLDRNAPDSFWGSLDLERYTLLPNTAGCATVKDTVRPARSAWGTSSRSR